MRTVNVAAAASFALVLSVLMSPAAKAQTPGAIHKPPAAAAQAAPRIGAFLQRADIAVVRAPS